MPNWEHGSDRLGNQDQIYAMYMYRLGQGFEVQGVIIDPEDPARSLDAERYAKEAFEVRAEVLRRGAEYGLVMPLPPQYDLHSENMSDSYMRREYFLVMTRPTSDEWQAARALRDEPKSAREAIAWSGPE